MHGIYSSGFHIYFRENGLGSPKSFIHKRFHIYDKVTLKQFDRSRQDLNGTRYCKELKINKAKILPLL